MIAVYDLEVGPVSFDFVVFLVKAELERIRRNEKRLHVCVVPFASGVRGMFRDKTALYDGAEMEWRLWNIVMPAAKFVGASISLVSDWGMAERICDKESVWPKDWDNQTLRNRPHLIGDIISASVKGEAVPVLRAPDYAVSAVRRLNPKPFVTITQRSTYLPARNSDPAEWAAARAAIERKYPVVVMRDVREALSAGSGFAELNLDLRMAFYQEAALNLQSNNGTAALCWFSGKPYRMFDAAIGESKAEWEGLFVEQGLPLGKTWPWAKPQQKIIYEKATRAAIVKEFEEWAGATN